MKSMKKQKGEVLVAVAGLVFLLSMLFGVAEVQHKHDDAAAAKCEVNNQQGK
jgi:hypothetical protein